MSRIARTRSAAAGIEAPATSVGHHSEPLGNAAAAAKNRHCDLRQHQQEAKSQQPPVVPGDRVGQHSTDMPQVDLVHQGSKDENILVSTSDVPKALDGKLPPADGNTHIPSDSLRAARTRSLPPKPSTARTRSAKLPSAKAAQEAAPAVHALPDAPAEHALPAAHAAPSANRLSSTLAGIAHSLVTFSNKLHAAPADSAEAVTEQIDMDFDFTNDSDDSDFQPEQEPAQADDEVIDLSQEDPLDVIEHPDGLIAIRSPLQAAAAAATKAGGEEDDDEDEFQQQGKGKRKQAAKDPIGGESTTSPCLLGAHLTMSSYAMYFTICTEPLLATGHSTHFYCGC